MLVFFRSLSLVGLAVASLLFAISVTPSLIPRTYVVQGLLSGFALAIGYAIGIAAVWGWSFLELPTPNGTTATRLKWGLALLGIPIVFGFLWRMTFWQNSIRTRMEMQSVDITYALFTVFIALPTAMALLLMARLLRRSSAYTSHRLQRFMPRRLANALGFLIVGCLAMIVLNDVILAQLLQAADRAFAQLDRLDETEMAPRGPVAVGGDQSLIAWQTIGRQGKEFINHGPSQADIADFLQRDAAQPIRVYAGYRSGDDEHERARLAVEELIRSGGFDRKVLIVATPTGTGWLDPNAVDSVEYMHAGNTAIVSTQYSYLPSWLTILIDPNRSRESAQALFNEVYAHWTKLPPQSRPKLYLHGLSLGAMGAESSADLYTIFEDPIHGAVFSGTPFPSSRWRATP